MLSIQYLIQFQENKTKTLVDSTNKVNAMTPIFVKTLDLKSSSTSVDTQKIDSTYLKTNKIVSMGFFFRIVIESAIF